MLAEGMAMMSLLMESIVISFALGGVVGAVIAVHLLYRKQEMAGLSHQGNELLESQNLLQREIDARFKNPPHL